MRDRRGQAETITWVVAVGIIFLLMIFFFFASRFFLVPKVKVLEGTTNDLAREKSIHAMLKTEQTGIDETNFFLITSEEVEKDFLGNAFDDNPVIKKTSLGKA